MPMKHEPGPGMEKTCPICGVLTRKSLTAIASYPGYEQHRCDPKTLAAIDAALSRDEQAPPSPTFEQRLSEGMRILGVK